MSASSRSSRSACAFSSSRFCSSSPMRACSSCVWVCPPGAGGEVGTGERSTGERKPEKERKKREREAGHLLCARQENRWKEERRSGEVPAPRCRICLRAEDRLQQPCPSRPLDGATTGTRVPSVTPHVALPFAAPGEEPQPTPHLASGSRARFSL